MANKRQIKRQQGFKGKKYISNSNIHIKQQNCSNNNNNNTVKRS